MDFTAGPWAVISLGMERIPGLSSPEFSVGSALCSSQGCALVVRMGWEGSLDLGMLPVERHLAGRCLWHQPDQAGLWLLQKYSGVKCVGFPSLLLKLFSCLLCLLSCLWELFPLALILPFPGHSAAAEGSCWREQPCAWPCLLPCSGNHGSLQFSSLACRKSQPSHGKTG